MDIFKLFLENIPYPIWIEGIDSTVLYLNKQYEKIYNIKFKNVRGKKIEDIFPKETSSLYNEQIKKCKISKSNCVFKDIIDGKFIECHMFPLINSDKTLYAVAGIIIDVTDTTEREIEIKNQKNILRTIIDSLPEAIFYKDSQSRFLGYNKNFEDFYRSKGVTEIIGKTDLEIYPDKKVAQQFMNLDKELMNKKESRYSRYTIIDDNGQVKFEESIKVPVINDKGEVWGVVGLSRDITESKKLEEKLRYLSYTDTLTGLLNRSSFEEKISELNHNQYLPLGVIMGDVNGLKLVNDTFGHLEGDKLLKNISSVLKHVCEDKGLIFRWGGDEFIILLPNSDEKACEIIIKDILELCSKSSYNFIQLSIALGESVKYSIKDDIYSNINEVEKKVYRRKLLDKKSIQSTLIGSLSKTLEEKNMETDEHTVRVTNYANAIGKSFNLMLSELDELSLVAKLHDIGKIGISEEILLKPGKLTKEEFEIMKTHTEKGYRIIQASGELENIAKCVLTHHENWDGTGYPLALKGTEIPLMARIISVVDSFDVMTHERPYKKAMSVKDAVKELRRCSGSQFDPEIVEIFIKYLKENNIT